MNPYRDRISYPPERKRWFLSAVFALAGAALIPVCSVVFSGCVAALPVFEEADSLAKDGEFALALATGLANAYFAAHPNPTAEAEAKKIEGDAMLALVTLENLAAGGADLSGGNGDVSDAILAFQTAFGNLEKLLDVSGVAAPHGTSAGAERAAADVTRVKPRPNMPWPKLMSWHPVKKK